MKEYKEFPPENYFLRVLKTHPQSALLYLSLWKKKDKHGKFSIRKKDIRKEFLISPTVFRNLISPLVVLDIVNFWVVNESEEKFNIEILGKNV